MSASLRILSVNVARPSELGVVNGEPVLSGIGKKALSQPTVFVGATNIAGDGQADLSVHGGVDKAVYAYPSDHWPWWQNEHGFASAPAAFGENLTLAGADETMVAIGDRFRWGGALLEVSQPRAPCFKFALHAKRPDAPQLMTLSARCGWYLRVIEEGDAPVNGALLVRDRASAGPSVRDAFAAALHKSVPRDLRQRVFESQDLASAWRSAVARWLKPA